jgi:hypothetical protein
LILTDSAARKKIRTAVTPTPLTSASTKAVVEEAAVEVVAAMPVVEEVAVAATRISDVAGSATRTARTQRPAAIRATVAAIATPGTIAAADLLATRKITKTTRNANPIRKAATPTEIRVLLT